MLKAFASVGVCIFDLTCTDLSGQKMVYRANQPIELLTAKLPAIFDTAQNRQWNIIVRPHAPSEITLIQLDDLTTEKLEPVRDVSFLIVETSPGNCQAWVAVAGGNEQTIRRCRAATDADKSASGALRLAGSLNLKPKHAPDYPTVALLSTSSGRIVSEVDLSDRKLLAALPEEACLPPAMLQRGVSRAAVFGPAMNAALETLSLQETTTGRTEATLISNFA